MTEQAAAGWYTDPHNPAGKRYWDGSAWTDQVQGGFGPPPLATAPQERTGLWVGIGIAAVVLIGLFVAAAFAFAAAVGDDDPADVAAIADDSTNNDSTDNADDPVTADDETEPATDGTVIVGTGTHLVTLPEGWIVAPEDELMRATFEGMFGEMLEYNGMWAESPSPSSARAIVQSIDVPGSEEAMRGGAAGAEGNLIATSDSVVSGEQTWRPTAHGLPAMTQTFVAEQMGQTFPTTILQVDLGERTLQITLMGSGSIAEIEEIAWALADSVVPTT